MHKMGIILFLFSIGMFSYVIWRFFVIFGNNSKLMPFIIAIILTIFVLSTFMYLGNSKILDIIGTLSSWIIVLGFILFIILIIEHIISIWYKVNPRVILGMIVLILGVGIYFSLQTKITNLDIRTDKIQKDIKILFVSDIHAENITKTFHINKIKDTIEHEKPDFVIIAGDLINKPNSSYVKYFKDFGKDTSIFAVIGNHDVFGNREVVDTIPANSNIIFLNNESIQISSGCTDQDTGKCLQGINVIGIVDKSLWKDKTLDQILNDSNIHFDSGNFSILITHQPISLEKLQNYPIDLELAGHTHRGQFYGIRKVVEWVNDYAYGEYKFGDKIAFVTQGIGTWGLPFRLGTQSEIVIINLKKISE